jgi:CpeT protein
MNTKLLACAAALSLAGCAALTPGDKAPMQDPKLTELASLMTGYFSSAEQAKADKDYLDIELRVVPVWQGRSDGPWLYVEQADARTPDKPYRQRVYRLVNTGDGRYESRVYTIKGNPLLFAGAWKMPTPLADIAPENLFERVGCGVFLTQVAPKRWKGATNDKDCPSDLRGAAYATAEVDVYATGMISWDRGMSADDKQVWGATKGGYLFKKLADRVK